MLVPQLQEIDLQEINGFQIVISCDKHLPLFEGND
jgi:hypothetical protein